MAGGGMMPPQGNVYDQSAWALNQGMGMANAAGQYQPMNVKGSLVTPTTVAGTNLNPYLNPYTSTVIDTTMGQMDQSRQMAVNDTGASATAAGAFGGSRHGVAEAQTNAASMDQQALMAANLNQANYSNAMGLAQYDAGAMNQGRQFNSGLNMQAQLANQNAGLQQANTALGAAGQMGNLSNLGFGMGQQIGQDQMMQGNLQQATMQALIDASRNQWAGFAGAPQQSLAAMLGAVGGSPGAGAGTTTQQYTPGLFDYLSLGLGTWGQMQPGGA